MIKSRSMEYGLNVAYMGKWEMDTKTWLEDIKVIDYYGNLDADGI